MGWYERTGRWFEKHRFAVDLTTAAMLGLFMLVAATDVYSSAPYLSRTGSIAWTVALLAPVPWRRTRPVPSAVAVFAVALAHMVAGYPMIMPGDLLVLLALYSVTVYGPSWAHVTAIGATAVGSIVALPIAVAARSHSGASGIIEMVPLGIFCLVTGLAVWAFALVRRSRLITLEALRDRAHRLEVERDQQIQIGAAAERARIAREMHDIVAHSLSIVVAQADGGRYAAAADPPAAVRALATISETGRAALTDMRRLLGVLRAHDDAPTAGDAAAATSALTSSTTASSTAAPALAAGQAPADDPARPAPQPGAGDLAGLVDQARASGLRVALARIGDERPLPAGMGLTLYRVCQESLSNVRKHAGPDPSVSVTVAWGPSVVRLEVTDDGRGAAAPGGAEPGFGLRGMRERAGLYGGTLETGPRAGGGFRVLLELPLPEQAPSAADPETTTAASPTTEEHA